MLKTIVATLLLVTAGYVAISQVCPGCDYNEIVALLTGTTVDYYAVLGLPRKSSFQPNDQVSSSASTTSARQAVLILSNPELKAALDAALDAEDETRALRIRGLLVSLLFVVGTIVVAAFLETKGLREAARLRKEEKERAEKLKAELKATEQQVEKSRRATKKAEEELEDLISNRKLEFEKRMAAAQSTVQLCKPFLETEMQRIKKEDREYLRKKTEQIAQVLQEEEKIEEKKKVTAAERQNRAKEMEEAARQAMLLARQRQQENVSLLRRVGEEQNAAAKAAEREKARKREAMAAKSIPNVVSQVNDE